MPCAPFVRQCVARGAAKLLGALVVVLAAFVVNGVFGFTARLELMRLVTILVATTLAAWIVSLASARVLASYGRRFGFFVLMGLWLVTFSAVPRYGIGQHPLGPAVALGLFDLGLWTLAGAVMAWRLRPSPAAA